MGSTNCVRCGANLKLIDQQAKLAESAGELTRNLELLQEGKLQEVSYGEGVIEAASAIVTKTQALSKAIGAYQTTNDDGVKRKLAYIY